MMVAQGPRPDQQTLVDHIDECETCLETLAGLTEMEVVTPWPEAVDVPEFLLRPTYSDIASPIEVQDVSGQYHAC